MKHLLLALCLAAALPAHAASPERALPGRFHPVAPEPTPAMEAPAIGIIGTRIQDYLGECLVVDVLAGSGAERAGILRGDVITQVDGREIRGLSIQEISHLLRGFPNTVVAVTVRRDATGRTHVFSITRGILNIRN